MINIIVIMKYDPLIKRGCMTFKMMNLQIFYSQKEIDLVLEAGFNSFLSRIPTEKYHNTVDGRNPAPPDMYETL